MSQECCFRESTCCKDCGGSWVQPGGDNRNAYYEVLLMTMTMIMIKPLTSINASFICASLTGLHLDSGPYLEVVLKAFGSEQY